MPNLKVMRGVLQQTVVNNTITDLRETGARNSDFEAIVPLYVRLEQDPALVYNYDVVGPWNFNISFGGLSSGIALKWQVVKTDTGGAILDTNLEWYVPNFFPPMFDELIQVQIASDDLGQLLRLEYLMYYEIRRYSELDMVQAIESYPVGLL